MHRNTHRENKTMQRFTTRLALAALVALALSTTRLAAAGAYTITDLGTLPGKANSFDWQQSINNDGVVAAYSSSSNPADPNAFADDSSFHRMAMSPRNFARLFHSETGDTPAQFAERARADAARCKLEQSDLLVEIIAEEYGFGNTERMRRTFQRLFNVSPHDYRARFRSTLLT
jgi:hypothetical protein